MYLAHLSKYSIYKHGLSKISFENDKIGELPTSHIMCIYFIIGIPPLKTMGSIHVMIDTNYIQYHTIDEEVSTQEDYREANVEKKGKTLRLIKEGL